MAVVPERFPAVSGFEPIRLLPSWIRTETNWCSARLPSPLGAPATVNAGAKRQWKLAKQPIEAHFLEIGLCHLEEL